MSGQRWEAANCRRPRLTRSIRPQNHCNRAGRTFSHNRRFGEGFSIGESFPRLHVGQSAGRFSVLWHLPQYPSRQWLGETRVGFSPRAGSHCLDFTPWHRSAIPRGPVLLHLSHSNYSLPLADSLIYATAQRLGAILWTQDDDFEGLPGVRYFAKSAIKTTTK